MNEKNIGKALVNLQENSTESLRNPHELAQQIIQRDRRRLRILAGISTFFWILTVAGVIWLIVFYFMYVTPRLDAYAEGRLRLENDWSEWKRAFNAAAEILLSCLLAFLFAALGTVLLVMKSRHATLRQINTELSNISEQLHRLQISGRQSANDA